MFGDRDLIVIAGGDFNAKNADWGCHHTSRRGLILQEAAEELDFNIRVPDEPTHCGTGRPDKLDLFLLKNVQKASMVRVIHELSSDHLPVVLEVGDIHHKPHYRRTKTFTDWTKFQQLFYI